MSPLPSTRRKGIIPPGWSGHHQPVVLGAFNARVQITDPTRATISPIDPATGERPAPSPHYVAGGPQDPRPAWREGVPCRVQAQNDDRAVEHAEQGVTVRLYLVQLPAGVPDIEVGYLLDFPAVPNDIPLQGETMNVSDVVHGSERFTRDIVAVHNQAPRQEG